MYIQSQHVDTYIINNIHINFRCQLEPAPLFGDGDDYGGPIQPSHLDDDNESENTMNADDIDAHPDNNSDAATPEVTSVHPISQPSVEMLPNLSQNGDHAMNGMNGMNDQRETKQEEEEPEPDPDRASSRSKSDNSKRELMAHHKKKLSKQNSSLHSEFEKRATSAGIQSSNHFVVCPSFISFAKMRFLE